MSKHDKNLKELNSLNFKISDKNGLQEIQEELCVKIDKKTVPHDCENHKNKVYKSELNLTKNEALKNLENQIENLPVSTITVQNKQGKLYKPISPTGLSVSFFPIPEEGIAEEKKFKTSSENSKKMNNSNTDSTKENGETIPKEKSNANVSFSPIPEEGIAEEKKFKTSSENSKKMNNSNTDSTKENGETIPKEKSNASVSFSSIPEEGIAEEKEFKTSSENSKKMFDSNTDSTKECDKINEETIPKEKSNVIVSFSPIPEEGIADEKKFKNLSENSKKINDSNTDSTKESEKINEETIPKEKSNGVDFKAEIWPNNKQMSNLNIGVVSMEIPPKQTRNVLTQTSVCETQIESFDCCSRSEKNAILQSCESWVRNQSVACMSSMEEESLRERIRSKLLKDLTEMVKKELKYTKDTFKILLHSKEFLQQFFKLFDQDGDNQLQQDSWIEFLKDRLSEEKQVDFAEQVESVAYVLCGDNPITPELFQHIFHAKGIVDKLFRLVDQDNIGTISAQQIMEFVTNITNTRPRTGFDKKSLESLEQLFRQTVGNEKEIRREDFQKIVISKNPFFTERVFQIFDKDNSGSISLQEFLDAMHQFAGQSPDDKIKFLFKIYDIDGDGLIQHRELQHVLRACMEENGMQFSDEQISDLTSAMFEDADTNNRGEITYEALKHQLEKHGGLLENLTISIDRWLVPPQPKAVSSWWGQIKEMRPYQLTGQYWRNNYIYLIFLAIFITINFGLFVSRAVQYMNLGANGYVVVARACGQCLNFDCMFILVLMLRQCITFLRTRGWSSLLPLDDHIYLHKVVGLFIVVLSFLHTLMHLLNFSLLVVNDSEVNSANFTISEWLFTSRPGIFGLVPGVANPTGIALIFILLIMFICSQSFVRRRGSFKVFYWTHLLYIPFWILVLLHGPNFWKWFIFPGVVYIIERILRLSWMSKERGKTYISSGLLFPSKVTHLVIKRPLHFDFHPGDYVFVNIPAIAKHEWHPFTISSAPEQEDYMWLHIRAVGEWTNRVYNYFDREQEKLHNGQIAPLIPGLPTTENDKKIQSPTMSNDSNTFKKLHASIKRKFSTRDPNRNKDGAQLVHYSCGRDTSSQVSASDGELQNRAADSSENLNKPLSPERRLQLLLLNQKVPLEKSLSMPDIQTKAKKRERLLVLREYMRSESERSFDECQVRRARLQSLGLAYLSPQNKSLAQSFRYLRHKPTIIAFKTPSLENCEQQLSTSSLGSVGQIARRNFASPERLAEEGRTEPQAISSPISPGLKPVNYPVGKPLEPIPEDRSIFELRDFEEDFDFDGHFVNQGTEIYLDGPYGAPSSHIFRAQHAVLIATGIGVTPFASILQSIMHRYWKARHTCPKCTYTWSSDIPATVMHLRKVDFFWINRDQRSFEWFVQLLSQLEMEQAELGAPLERFLHMHMYITSALQKSDMKAVGLQLALDLLHEKEKRDLITGLKTRTNAGRPNWDKVFKQLAAQRKGKVTVFYCGPPQLARLLRYKCDQHGFHFRKENF